MTKMMVVMQMVYFDAQQVAACSVEDSEEFQRFQFLTESHSQKPVELVDCEPSFQDPLQLS
jgi:hypothetical protein